MSSKSAAEVIIGGKVFSLCGYESEEYLQKVASYINNKLTEYGKIDSFRRQSADIQNVLLELNIADDYFKAKKEIDTMEEEQKAKDKEMYDLRHELVTYQIRLENAEDRVRELQLDLEEKNKRILQLETQLIGK